MDGTTRIRNLKFSMAESKAERLQEIAKLEKRSLAGQLRYVLERFVEQYDAPKDDEA